MEGQITYNQYYVNKLLCETVVQGQSPHVTFRSTVLAEGTIRSSINTTSDTK